jgi:hypothetical protein
MVNKEDIRKYFSRYFLGRVPVYSFSINDLKVNVLKLIRSIIIHGETVKASIISPLKFVCGKFVCVSNGIRMKSLYARILGGRINSYASGEIKTKGTSLKIIVKLKKWSKNFSLIPQERRNRLSFIPKSERTTAKNEFNLAYFQPIIYDNVVKLVLNKQDGSLLIWYNSINKSYNPQGLYMYKRIGDKDIDWRWVEIKS